VAVEHRAINRLVAVSNERLRRLLVGFLAAQMGYGGVSRMARITGMDRNTIARGQRELRRQGISKAQASSRVRRFGGGRKPVESLVPGC
jgi:hypothetical protein